MIALAIGRIKHRPSIPVLVRLLQDEQVAAQAASALGKMNAHETRDALLRLARNSKNLAKKEAERLWLGKDTAMAEEGAKIVGKNAPTDLRGTTMKILTDVWNVLLK